ncbi:MAG: adenosine kinase [Bacteroidota bacterium]
MSKVIGIGNALVDIMTRLESDDFLEQNNLPKGSMQLVNLEISQKVLNAAHSLNKSLASGGSAANTIHGLSNLDVMTGFIGKVGTDEFGSFFRKDMEKSNIKPELFSSTTETGRAIAFISPDSERTFATYLGAAVELDSSDLQSDMFAGYRYLHIEGYLVFNEDLVLRAVAIAKEKNMKVSLDLASYNVVEAKLEFLRRLTAQYVDIVFANEEEARAFTGKEPHAALDEIAEMCDIAVVKTGASGSLIKQGNSVFTVDAIKVKPVDTTGAGDLYASGFLYGLCRNLPLEKCGKAGSILAGKVIEVIGAKMPDESWKEIHQMINNM